MITIIDYGVGNVNAFSNVYRRLNIDSRIAKTAGDLVGAQKLILPGVGAFDYAMKRLNDSGMRDALDVLVMVEKVHVMGVCVGMQMLAKGSDEGKMEGLNWIDATVKKFDESKILHDAQLPHMGWNDVVPERNIEIFKGLEKESIFYFLHSYYFHCNSVSDVIATSEYGGKFTSAVNRGNIYGVQFHPEKSHQFGETLLYNFANLK